MGGYQARTHFNCHLHANHLILLLSLFFSLCKTGNVAAAAEPWFLSLLAAQLRGAGARLVAGFGLSWDPKVSSFSLSRARNYLLGCLPLIGLQHAEVERWFTELLVALGG